MNVSFRRLIGAAALAFAVTTGIVGGGLSPAAAAVPSAPGPCVDPLAMPDWCQGIPPHGPLPPALNFTTSQLKPIIR